MDEKFNTISSVMIISQSISLIIEKEHISENKPPYENISIPSQNTGVLTNMLIALLTKTLFVKRKAARNLIPSSFLSYFKMNCWKGDILNRNLRIWVGYFSLSFRPSLKRLLELIVYLEFSVWKVYTPNNGELFSFKDIEAFIYFEEMILRCNY